ncbi:MAG: PDZ domain-containing protein, partial [Armatimonadia bacterium]
MFRRTLLALVIAIVWLTPLLAVPLTLYVSPDGNDGFEGTKKRPLATLAGARDAVRASGMAGKTEVRVEFAPGTYRLKAPVVFGPGDSGTQACPVRYIGAAGQRGGTVLSGGQLVTGWR